MKITLFDYQLDKDNRIRREYQGGFGLQLNIGTSFLSRLLLKISKTANTPVLNFAYIAAYARKYGHHVIVSEDDVKEDADVIIMNASMLAHEKEMTLARTFSKRGQKVFFIGPLPTVNPDLFIEKNISAVIGEPESAFQRMFESGVIESGKIDSSEIKDLNSLPFPDWSAFPYETYSLEPKIHSSPVFPMLTSRSCPYTCNYCPYLVLSKTYRRRSNEHIISEIKYLQEKYGMKGVFFRDATFTFNRAATVEFTELVKKENITFEYMFETRIDCLDEELLDILWESGLRGINVGIENFDLNTLKKNKRKPISIEMQERIIRYAEKIGIKINSFFLFAYPEDTIESIEKTIKYSHLLNTYSAVFYILTPMPGTEAYLKIKNKINAPLEDCDGFTLTFEHDNLSKKDLEQLLDKAFVSYYFRLKFIFKYFKDRFLKF